MTRAMDTRVSRRSFLRGLTLVAGGLGFGGGLGLSVPWAEAESDPLLSGRPLVRYPEKTELIQLTARPPQLETPMSYFDRAITPNEAFFVRYHNFPIPTSVDLDTWRLEVKGHVDSPLSLSMDQLKKFPVASVTAVAQCSGNSRGRFTPRVFGGQWGDGAMGNAVWTGARLQDVLKAAGVRQGGLDVTFDGLDKPAFPSVPDYVKALDLQRIMNDPDVIIAYEMNGERLPMLNGFPARLVVPGWYATYWVKNLSEIAVLAERFEKFWVKPGYRIPDTPGGAIEPGTTPKATVPITRMTVRSFIATPTSGTRVKVTERVALKGIAFDGGKGIREVLLSDNAGETWARATLGHDHGRYSFREWSATWTPRRAGEARLMVRAVNGIGESQGHEPLWNPAGYLRNVIEQITLVVV